MKRWYSTNARAIGPASSGRRKQNTRSQGTKTSSNTVRVSSILCFDDTGCSQGWRAPPEYGDTYIESPFVSGGTANATAKSASSAFIARVGSTSTSLAFGVSEVCILAPRTTMPSSLRSTTCTCMSGSSCSKGAFERSPFTSVCATATARSSERQ